MLRFPNVATPADAVSLSVPARVAPLGFGPRPIVTVPVKLVATLPCASCAVTATAGVSAAPAVVLPGWTLNVSCVAAPGVTLNGALAAPERPVADAARV